MADLLTFVSGQGVTVVRGGMIIGYSTRQADSPPSLTLHLATGSDVTVDDTPENRALADQILSARGISL